MAGKRPNRRQVKTKRTTKQVNRLKNTDRAWLLCLYGYEREPSDIEKIVWDSLFNKDQTKAAWELFVDAQRRGDKTKLREIARAIKSYRRPDFSGCFINHLEHVAFTLKSLQTPFSPPVPPHKRIRPTVREILEMAYPRRNFPRLSDKQYADMLATSDKDKAVRRLVKRIGLQLAPPGAPRKKLDK